jgi:hypothetical protein
MIVTTVPYLKQGRYKYGHAMTANEIQCGMKHITIPVPTLLPHVFLRKSEIKYDPITIGEKL